MKKILFIMMIALSCCGFLSAQEILHWTVNVNQYMFNQPLVAFVQINGEYVTSDDFVNYEVGAFYNGELRGSAMMTADYGDSYPIIEMPVYYYDGENNQVTFKLYDKSTEQEVAECEASMEILLGSAHVELYADEAQALVLNFNLPPTFAITIDDGNVDTDNWEATPATAPAGETVTLSYGGKKKVENITIEKDTYKIDAVYTITAQGQSESQDLSIADDASLPFTKKLIELDPYGSQWELDNIDAAYITVSGDNIVKGTDANWDTEITINGAGTATVSYVVQNTGFVEVGSATITFTVTKSKAAVTPTENKNEWQFTMPACDAEVVVEYETALALNEEDDNTETLDEWDGYETDVTLTRAKLTGGMWNTLTLPFSVSSDALNALKALIAQQQGQQQGYFMVKKLIGSSLEGPTVFLNFEDATEIVAGTPYLVKVSKDVNLATLPAAFAAYAQIHQLSIENPFKDAEVSQELHPVTSTYIDFIPTLGKTTIEGVDTENILFVAAENKLKHPAEMPAYMKGFRAYFQLHDAVEARAFKLNLDDDATGVVASDNGELKMDNSVYDLQGRKVEKAQKGVYIVNGKKVIK